MPLLPYDSFRNLDQWKSSLDKFFNDAQNGFGFLPQLNSTRIDVFETDTEVVAHCELPGLENKEDVHIHVDDDVLTIHGVVTRSAEIKEDQMHRKERFSGSFQRSVALRSPVNADETTATYKNGILEVRMPKLAQETHKRIDIQFQ